MIDVQGWLGRFPGARWTPLLATNDALEVQTHQRGRALDRRLLTRAPGFDSAVTEMIETGLQDPTWTGLLYLMGTGDAQDFKPLYIGKTERRGVVHEVSQNIANIRHNADKFARWGTASITTWMTSATPSSTSLPTGSPRQNIGAGQTFSSQRSIHPF